MDRNCDNTEINICNRVFAFFSKNLSLYKYKHTSQGRNAVPVQHREAKPSGFIDEGIDSGVKGYFWTADDGSGLLPVKEQRRVKNKAALHRANSANKSKDPRINGEKYTMTMEIESAPHAQTEHGGAPGLKVIVKSVTTKSDVEYINGSNGVAGEMETIPEEKDPMKPSPRKKEFHPRVLQSRIPIWRSTSNLNEE